MLSRIPGAGRREAAGHSQSLCSAESLHKQGTCEVTLCFMHRAGNEAGVTAEMELVRASGRKGKAFSVRLAFQ
jgi:hypothetical protein